MPLSRSSPYFSLRDLGASFIAEGEEVVKALFRSKLQILSLLMEEKYLGSVNPPPGLKIEIATKEELKEITGYKMHQGIMAIGLKPENTPLAEMQGPAVVLNGIVDPENVGAIVRNAAAFGIQNLIVDRFTSPPYLRRSIKVSRGALFQMKLHVTDDLPTLLKGKEAVVTALNRNTLPLHEASFPENPYIVFGRESTGVDEEILKGAKSLIKIPIDSSVDSLNVAVASGIIFYTYKNKLS